MTDLSIRIHSFIMSAVSSLRREEGQDLIEYALFGGGLAILIIGAVALLNVTGSNPVEGALDGLKGCIDFTTSTSCKPY